MPSISTQNAEETRTIGTSSITWSSYGTALGFFSEEFSKSNYTTSSLSSSQSSTWYHNLPDNVFKAIFKHFDEKELRKNIIPVCKRWRNAALQPELWKQLEIHGKQAPTQFICSQIRHFGKLSKVSLINVAEPITIVRQICRCLPYLKHLTLYSSDEISESCLRNIIKSCRHLETIDLRGTPFRAKVFHEELSELKHLKSINFSGNPHLSVYNLMTVLLNCRGLEELYLSRFSSSFSENQLSDADASFMIANAAKSLRSLVLDATTLTDVAFQSILNCTNLECLGLYGACNLSGLLFTELWRYLPKLRHLKIRQAHQITDQDVVTLFTKGESVMKQLVTVDLTGCWKIKDVGLATIVNCCKNLAVLMVKSCKSIRDLQIIWKNCPKLQLLNIAFCNVPPQSLLPLPDSLKVLIIDENSTCFYELKKKIAAREAHVEVHVCLSEYSDDIKKIQQDVLCYR